MPELGKYAAAVLSSWGVTLALTTFIVIASWLQARRAKRRLDEIEAQMGVRGKEER